MSEQNQQKKSAADPESAEKGNLAQREEEILSFWREQRIFETSLENTKDGEEFVFYDGPPFATGLPHYGHLLASTLKDVVPRYQTMKGKHVPRRWGWDCHGLPAENEIETELNLNTRKEIEEYGIANFNEKAREAVQRYADEWRQIIPRIGRFVDMDNDYRTMDPEYTESVWWSFQELYDQGLVYKSFKSMHVCPRCETTLSNFEVGLGYAEITDLSVTVKFEIRNSKSETNSKLQIPKDKNTYLLAWTTTPWTLPGNVALAVHDSIEYVTAYVTESDEYVILAKECVDTILGDTAHEITGEFHGSELAGLEYKPLFDYYKDADMGGIENAFQVYSADFVTTDEGTGIVHIAPGYGADDLDLARQNNLPMIQHVGKSGVFADEVTDFAGMQAKPKDDPMATDVEIVKWLASNDMLFAKEKITHSYPHCWRCDTPLLNYAADSWFVRVTDFKNQMVEENKGVHWVPEDVGRARFGNWLADARDWAISRTRFWGAPLPVWESEDGAEREVLGSRDELYQRAPDKIAKTFFLRHGESEKNVKNVYDSSRDSYGLTSHGEEQARTAAQELTEEGVDIIYTSPVRRARETAQIIADELGCDVAEADPLWEVDSGDWDGVNEDADKIADDKEAYDTLPPEEHYEAKRGNTGESWKEVEERTIAFIRRTLKDNPDKTIAFVGHQSTKAFALRPLKGWGIAETLEHRLWDPMVTDHATPTPVYIDRAREMEFDFHRPYIDEITFESDRGNTMRRIEDVFDCWYESGAMPYAIGHYPFETDTSNPPKHGGFPADFIAEGLDQTRGWFYSLMNLSTALFNEAPYKNVVTTGMLLAEDGSKMSKRKKNYPDPMDVVARYGADALRYYMLASPVVRSEPLHFSEKGVDEVAKKVLGRLKNVVSFYAMYADDVTLSMHGLRDGHVLDRWILARLDQLVTSVTDALDNYELDRATRPIGEFVDDLSAWYLRRSRERIKAGGEDANAALATTRHVLTEFSKVMAPFTPFIAEDIWQQIASSDDRESVHLASWPGAEAVDMQIINQMQTVRELISEALEVRANEGIKVRQPLQTMSTTYPVEEEYKEIMKDEVNVKEVEQASGDSERVHLDTELTDELRREGTVRELTRAIQDLRKQQGLQPGEEAHLTVDTDSVGQELIERWKEEIETTTTLGSITFKTVSDGKKVGAHDMMFTLYLSADST